MGVNNRINQALEVRGMKAVELAERSGISESLIASYRKQRWQPKQTALYSMAKVLEVSEMWLAGYDVPMERPVEQVSMDKLSTTVNTLRNNKRYQELVNAIIELDEEQLTLIENMVNQLKK